MTARKRLHDYDNDVVGPSPAKKVTVQIVVGSLVPGICPPNFRREASGNEAGSIISYQ